MVACLAECQAKLGSGYLSAYPESLIDRVERQQPVWAPYYTLHKIFAGLEDMYVYCDNTQALELARKFGGWVIARNSRLSDAQMQAMMGNEHGGMNETLANLYSLTGEKKYLDISLRFNHQAIIGPLSERQDRLTGQHANTTIPKFIGAARQFELTGTPALGMAAEFFWATVVNERSYVTGGNSDNERFTAKERLSTALGPKTQETCNTYNMLKLTRHLFCQDPRFVFSLVKPLRLAFQVRHPFWATAGYEVRINGKRQTKATAPGSYATLDRIWKSGDTVEVVMPFGLRTEGFRDNTNRFAILNGPLVLCAEVETNKPLPVVVGDAKALRATLKPIAGHPNSFTGAPKVFRTPDGQGREVTLEPFYKVHGNRSYTVYWDSK